MTYKQAIEYCTKRISRSTIPDLTDYARLQVTKRNCKNGKAGIQSIYSMFKSHQLENIESLSYKPK